MEQYNQTTDLFFEQPVVYAGFWDRVGAAFIDFFILLIPQVALVWLLPESLMTNVVSLLLTWLYYALLESGDGQATLGKRALGLKVANSAGQRISFGQATGRYFGKIISTLILCIGYLMMLWDPKKQTLHDKMADTYVVKA